MNPVKRILCVDDDEDTCILLKLLLFDFEIVATNTCADALKLAQSQRFDLYLLDSFLTDGSGITLCQQIRRFDPDTPVLFCSADAFQASRDQALQAGAQLYLTKPVEPLAIRQALERLLRKSG
jgi:CheY-like chemotaxis protein